MTQLISSYLSEVLKREEAATCGPWTSTRCKGEGWQSFKLIGGYQRAVRYRDFIRDFDADFIAHSRNDVHVLLGMVMDQQEVIAKNEIDPKHRLWLEERHIQRIEGEI